MLTPIQPIVHLAADSILLRELTAAQREAFWPQVWKRYDALVEALPKEPTLGATLVLRFAAVSVAAFRVLVELGVKEEVAYQLMSDMAWAIYEKMGRVPRAIGHSLHSDPFAQLHSAIHSFLHFPFGPPAYDIQEVDAGEKVIAFDVLRCPVAEFFRAQGLPRLCKETFCDLDYPLANQWDATLERTTTLADGDEKCNFRWYTKTTQAKAQQSEE